jgi:hypothetical protein
MDMTRGQKAIAVTIMRAVRAGGGVGFTASQFATICGLKKTPYLLGVIARLVNKDLLTQTVNPISPVKGWVYTGTDKLMSAKATDNE